MSTESQACCPAEYPEAWDHREVVWKDKLFVKGRVRSFLHIPLNFKGVFLKNLRRIEAAGAMPEELLIVSDDNSLWGADLYIAVTREVPGARMATLSGTFLTKVFEGPFQQIPTWIEQMKSYVASQGRQMRQLYFSYRTCPKCAKKYGKNYVVLLARV